MSFIYGLEREKGDMIMTLDFFTQKTGRMNFPLKQCLGKKDEKTRIWFSNMLSLKYLLDFCFSYLLMHDKVPQT